MLTIRWRAIFAPVCWLLGHVWYGVQGVTAFDDSGYSCARCARSVSLNRCTCGHPAWHHARQSVHDRVWTHCDRDDCGCAAYVSEAFEAGAAA